jgi:hypothetical protein
MLGWLLGRAEAPRPPADPNVGWSWGAADDGRWGLRTLVFVADAGRPWSNRDLWLYPDGTCRVDLAQGRCTDVADLLDHVLSERVAPVPPDGALVVLDGRSPITATRIGRTVPEWEVDAAGLAADIEDMRSAVVGAPRAVPACRDAFRRYLDMPTDRTRAELQVAYRKVPPQMRPALLQTEKDEPIRMLLRSDLADSERDQLLAYCRVNFASTPR